MRYLTENEMLFGDEQKATITLMIFANENKIALLCPCAMIPRELVEEMAMDFAQDIKNSKSLEASAENQS